MRDFPLYLKPTHKPHQDAIFGQHSHLLDDPADEILMELCEVKAVLVAEDDKGLLLLISSYLALLLLLLAFLELPCELYLLL